MNFVDMSFDVFVDKQKQMLQSLSDSSKRAYNLFDSLVEVYKGADLSHVSAKSLLDRGSIIEER